MKQYKILHIPTGNYICAVIDFSNTIIDTKTMAEIVKNWMRSEYGCSWFLNENFIYDKKRISINSFTNKKNLNRLINDSQFLYNIDIDLNNTNTMRERFTYNSSPEEFEIVEA